MNPRGRTDRERDEPPSGDGQRVDHGPRIALAVALVILTYALFPAVPAASYPTYAAGSVAGDNVIAPFAFRVLKSGAELAREREALARTVDPVFVFAPAAFDTARGSLRAFAAAVADTLRAHAGSAAAVQAVAASHGVTLDAGEARYLADPAARALLLDAVGQAYGRWLSGGVADSGALDGVRGNVTLVGQQEERSVAADSVRTYGEFAVLAHAFQPDVRSAVARRAFAGLLRAFFHPTIVADRAATAARREQLGASVPVSKYDVRAGELIVGANEVVGADQHEKLVALRRAMDERRSTVPALRRVAGALLFDALLLGLLGLTILIFRPHVYASLRSLFVIAAVIGLVIAGGAVVSHLRPIRPELIPVSIAAIVISALFDRRIAMIVAVLLAALLAGQAEWRGANALFVNIIGGATAAFSVRAVRTRQQAYGWIAVIAAAYGAASVAIGLMLDLPVRAIVAWSGYGALNAAISVLAALLLLPLAERYTGIETDLTLLEWSDLNRPLMQRLSLEAPGTFGHSMVIANLAEAGCRAISANAGLARVGAYYHDIGKLARPQYFVENQSEGRNPHDKLTPLQSARIIRDHVREGLQLAEEYRVPRVLRAFIAEHHGTATISYFLARAREQGGAAPDVADYRYAGPIPRSAETAVLMLADGAEAAARVIHEPTPARIRDVVDHIVGQRLEQGQLNDAPLTLRQLERVKEEFTRVLAGMHHVRIAYPAADGGVSARFASR